MTPHREDYIKAVYTSNLNHEKTTNKHLAEVLAISPPSVTEMLKKLIEADVLKKDNELGYVLTRQGVLEAQRLINKHRLWEVFLVEHLGYSWENVHDDAEVLEHATSDELVDRLNRFLEYPTSCPHGSIIYGNAQHGNMTIMLNEVLEKQTICIRRVQEDNDLLQYLLRKKVVLDQPYRVETMDNFDESITLVNALGERIELSVKAARALYVEVMK